MPGRGTSSSPRAADWTGAVQAWTAALGATQVATEGAPIERLNENVSALTRRVPAVLWPRSTEEVQRVVQLANLHHTPLYPVSCGMNWGLGSSLPVCDETAVVDLRRMNRIHAVDVPHHFADIEPGVTQGQLYDYLQDRQLPLRLNVTGSGRDSSLIGNALERGIGYFATRAGSLSGLEVVLGDGTLVRTGFAHLATSTITHQYPAGIGPDISGLFAQSNFGIVTRAGFSLMPAEGEALSIVAKIADDTRLVPFVEALIGLRRRGVVQTIWHLGNRGRTEIALAPLVADQLRQAQAAATPAALREQARTWIAQERFGAWNAVGGIFGSPALLRHIRREIKAALRGIADVMFLNDRTLAVGERLLNALPSWPLVRRKRLMLQAMKPLYRMAQGIPTDAALKSVYWPVGQDTRQPIRDVDPGYSGMLYVLPFFPLTGEVAREVVELATTTLGAAGFTAYITLNFIDTQVAEAVVNCAFDRRNPEQTAAAHRAINALTDAYIARGYPPYRLGIQQMDKLVNGDDPFWRTVLALKQTLDPHHIIAPGRYCPR